jgi:hypothetical protein
MTTFYYCSAMYLFRSLKGGVTERKLGPRCDACHKRFLAMFASCAAPNRAQ